MSRAGLAGVALIGGALGLVIYLLTRGLPDDAKAAAAEVESALSRARTEVGDQKNVITETITQDAAFLGARPEVAAAQAELATIDAAVAEVAAKYENELKPLLDKNRHADGDRVRVVAAELSSAAAAATASVTLPAENVRRLLSYKQDHEALVQTARLALTEVEVLGRDASLPALVQASASQYPEAAPALNERLAGLTNTFALVTQEQAKLDTALATKPLDYVAVGRLAEGITQTSKALSTARSKLMTDVAGLGKSIDRILIDMKEEDGLCYHKYRQVENGLAQESDFELVDCAFYREHEDHLGMALYSKPEGTLDEAAVKVASPPGYTYVGNPRYGQWQESNGTRFWVFYGQYALMRDLLWGSGSYRPVYDRDYQSYRTNVSARKPWFGGSNEFGTRGATTKMKYGGSTFYRREAEKARYSGSRFQETNQGRGSGGGYQGSRYQGGGGSPVRSGGNRSAPARRSSFGGGGK